ncbi:endolytic transglycosylase MltG [Anaerobium acetethylicum]|uniref:UPF0755 protein n=1 Tax=Anaerobium acetethylicum TaxID=1619234 RepID=A0A1D3TQQ0_9FIRM|nr:endolytic transglycosylase MltG [Anaerobium acetethylicum]SCP95956.1 UPF0755 protein [Anaerobium acetethylicum]
MSVKKVVNAVLSISFHIIISALVIIGIFVCAKEAYSFGTAIFSDRGVEEAPGTDVNITVAEGASTISIGRMLQEKGLVEDFKLFYVQAKVSKYSGKIKPGDYTLNTSMSAEKMLSVMSGEIPEEITDEGGTAD